MAEKCRNTAAQRCLAVLVAVAGLAGHAIAGSTLSDVRARGRVLCGVVSEADDWNKVDAHGDLSALGTEVCRALAVAALGRDATEPHAYPAEPEALAALAHRDVDLVVGATPSASRERRYGLTFGPAVFVDDLTLMERRGVAGLAGRTICFIDGTDWATTVLAAFVATARARGVALHPFPFQEEGEMASALSGGRCDAAAGYASRLATMRARLPAPPPGLVLVPGHLAEAPANVVTRDGDESWSRIVAATVELLFRAQLAGIDRATVASLRAQPGFASQRLLGRDWLEAASMGLPPDWPDRVLATVGNYGEVFDRAVGLHSPLGLEPPKTKTCPQGGALCAPPVP